MGTYCLAIYCLNIRIYAMAINPARWRVDTAYVRY